MKKIAFVLTSLTVLSLGSAYADDKQTYDSQTSITKDANGNYSEKDKTTANDGTVKNISEKKIKATVDSNGNTDRSVNSEDTQKRGWFDKDTTKVSDTEKTKSDGTVETSHKKVVNGTTVENDTHTIAPQQ